MREGGYSDQKEYYHKSKTACKGNKGLYIGEVCNQQVDIVAQFWGFG